MHTGSRYLVFSVIVGIAFLAFGSVDSAYATTFTISNQDSCENGAAGIPPGIGGNWTAATSTCTKIANLSIMAGDTMTVNNGVTLAFPLDDNLINRGSITNNGIINITEGLIDNLISGTFTNSGTIILNGTSNGHSRLINQDSASFTNFGIISIDGGTGFSGRLINRESAVFANVGTIAIEGTSNNSGRLLNQDSADFTNSGVITIDGTNNNSGQLRNTVSASFTNSGTITLTGTNSVSGQIRNLSILINSGSISTNNGFNNNDPDSVLTNSGSIQITLVLDNTGGLIDNTCGTLTFASISGNPIEEEFCQTSFGSTAYEDPTIGKSHNGKQMVENGICIDEQCWTVTAAFHQDFELVEMLSDSTHTITATVFCQHGVHKCNYVAYGVSPYGTNINDSVWKVILQKDHLDNWTMKVVDPDEYLGEVTSTTQIVNDNKHLAASATIEFKKPTPGMILNVEVRDSKGGYRDFKFNDGIAIVDSYAYPSVESSYEAPLDIEPLCLNENPDKRYTCAFEKIREQTLIDAQLVYKDVMNKKY